MRLIIAIAVACSAGIAHAQTPPRWRLVEEWRVGGKVDGPHSLGNVLALRVMPDGRIVLLDGKDQQLHILSSKGEPIRTVGRRGGGPGEFQNADGFLIMPDGRIMVHDPTSARLTTLSSAGDMVRTTYHPGWGEGGLRAWNARFNADGRLEEYGHNFQMDRATGVGAAGPGFRRTWRADFLRADTVLAPTCPNTPREPSEEISWQAPASRPGWFQSVPYPFIMFEQGEAIAPDGTAWLGVYPEFKTIQRVTFGTCNVVATVALRGPVVPLPAWFISRMSATLRSAARGFTGKMAPDPARLRKALPYFESLLPDAMNQLWVARLIPETVKFDRLGSAIGSRRFDVYSPEGKLLAEVAAPEGMFAPPKATARTITSDHMYAIVLDDDDVPFLVGYRIVHN